MVVCGKLQPKWQGKWKVIEVKTPINVKITDGQTTKVVHVNRLQHRKQPQPDTVPSSNTYTNWVPPQIDHHVFPVSPPERRYPQRTRRPPNWLRLQSLRSSFKKKGTYVM